MWLYHHREEHLSAHLCSSVLPRIRAGHFDSRMTPRRLETDATPHLVCHHVMALAVGRHPARSGQSSGIFPVPVSALSGAPTYHFDIVPPPNVYTLGGLHGQGSPLCGRVICLDHCSARSDHRRAKSEVLLNENVASETYEEIYEETDMGAASVTFPWSETDFESAVAHPASAT